MTIKIKRSFVLAKKSDTFHCFQPPTTIYFANQRLTHATFPALPWYVSPERKPCKTQDLFRARTIVVGCEHLGLSPSPPLSVSKHYVLSSHYLSSIPQNSSLSVFLMYIKHPRGNSAVWMSQKFSNYECSNLYIKMNVRYKCASIKVVWCSGINCYTIRYTARSTYFINIYINTFVLTSPSEKIIKSIR